ncbi:hypothetical protein PoB_006907500 [Plakobranchus ocellatus]|uniref:Uncharacterized protein n=1 Tax=Plakobranchus ocellatus TaxID=259542 RepID=A0AAV4DEZ9_9GAST|nr:hypothetical protein PoB_006907500 [Plakobranchus ocellatus]
MEVRYKKGSLVEKYNGRTSPDFCHRLRLVVAKMGKMWKFVLATYLTMVTVFTEANSANKIVTCKASARGNAICGRTMRLISDLEKNIDKMGRQIMLQQLFVEERIRTEGDSGIKAVRQSNGGTRPLYGDTHVGYSALNIFNRSDTERMLGIDDFVAVMNGVDFQSVSNGGYGLKKPTSNRDKLDEVEDIDLPEVPLEVSSKPTVQEQIDEMRLWFKAFKEQDYSVRDYRKYFKPNICYLEGAWHLNPKTVDEPETSKKHFDDAKEWFEEMDLKRFQSYGGLRSEKENFDYKPTVLYKMSKNKIPHFARWKSRLLCQPASHQVPTTFFQPQHDLATRIRNNNTWEELPDTLQARFKLNEFGTERRTTWTLLDDLMAGAPGKENAGNFIREEVFGNVVVHVKGTDNPPLNTGNYHRWYKLLKKSAMGVMVNHRGFRDENLWLALNNQKEIMPLHINMVRPGGVKYQEIRRISFAMPLEIVYTTPLAKWNPYDIEHHGENNENVERDDRTGELNMDHAYNGSSAYIFHRTPKEFYSQDSVPESDIKGVLDSTGNLRTVVGSGTRVFTWPIDNVGEVRLRYPIFPVHSEGTTPGMELEALKDGVMRMPKYTYLYQTKPMVYDKTTKPTDLEVEFLLRETHADPPGLHSHSFALALEDYEALLKGAEIRVFTSLNLAHNHELVIAYDGQNYRILSCDGQPRCWDDHSDLLDKVTR